MDKEKVTITGQFRRVKMRNFADGYTVFEVKIPATKTSPPKIITCTGNIIIPTAQITVEVTGKLTTTKYGEQLQRCKLKELLIDKESIYNYLLNIPKVGPKIATIVSENYENLNTLIELSEPEADLMTRCKLNQTVAENIVSYLRKNKSHIALFSLLNRYSDSAFVITEKICKDYGEAALTTFMQNPYEIGTKYDVPFSACDYVAKLAKIPIEDNPERMTAMAYKLINRAINDGDCCVPLAQVTANCRKRLSNAKYNLATKTAPSSSLIANALAAHNNNLIVENNEIYSRTVYWQEKKTAYAIKRIIRSGIQTDYDFDELCNYAEEVCGVKYAEQQREAFKAFQYGGLCVLTGGPGTGKTTVVKGLLAAYEKLFPNNIISLAAPTGRASQRMKEATGREASTIHRLLDYTPYETSFTCKNEEDPINADFLVIDESSMISIDLADLLFNAIKSGTMVLLVGDIEQLPSVGPGNVLADIIKSGIVPVFALTKTHRQGAGSPIIENAKRISQGNHHLVTGKDFEIIECDEKSIINAIRTQYIQYHDPKNPFAVQILSTTKKDALCGCHAINKVIQQDVNDTKEHNIHFGDTVYAINDKVMMLSNNYAIGYFNGDIGIIKHISNQEITVEINGEDINVPTSLLEDMSLAYASTIHKSQGSEYDVCIVIIPSRPISMLQRNILYTAITRAKKRVILIASEKTIFTCVNTVTAVQRNTKLCERLKENYANTRDFTKDFIPK